MQHSPEKILSDLIRIDSTNPPGNETAVAQYLKDLFSSVGVEGEVIEPEKGRGSFIARVGSGPRKILYLSHSDVVPAGEGWDFDPFSGEIKDGVVYGRGALDCKDLMAAQVSAAMELIKEGAPLKGELIIAATADEEKGGMLGTSYLLEHYPEKLKADFAVNEGADQPVLKNGKILYFLQVGEKGTAWSTIKASGKSGHGSVPTLADNAVVKISRAVTRLNNYWAENVLIPEVEKLFKDLAGLFGLDKNLIKPSEIDNFLEQLPLEKNFVEALRSMTRMTVSPNMIKGGTKTNIVPDYCEASVDIRIMPGQDCEYVESQLRPVIGKDVEIEFDEYQPATFTSSEEPYYKLMEEITLKMAGSEAICLPVISAGSTDSKFLRAAGIPSYGVGHMDKNFDGEARTTVHGRNERIDVASLNFKTAFLKQLARRYLA